MTSNTSPTPSTARVSDLMRAFNAQWLLKQAAQHAHEICNALRLKYPEFIELSDDGELHVAIHKILAVDTPCAAPMSNASIYQCHNCLGSGYDPDAGWDGNMIACGDCGGGLSPIRPTYYVRHPDDSYSVADPQPTAQLADLQGRLDKAEAARDQSLRDAASLLEISKAAAAGLDQCQADNDRLRSENAALTKDAAENKKDVARFEYLRRLACRGELHTFAETVNDHKDALRYRIDAAIDSQQEPRT